MRRNILQDAANTLPQMIMSERIGHADLETLAQLPDGMLSIDLLTRETSHAGGSRIVLKIVEHLADWLRDRLATRAIDLSDLTEARLMLALRTNAIPTDRARVIPFDWHCACTLATPGKVASGQAAGRTWYDRDRWRA